LPTRLGLSDDHAEAPSTEDLDAWLESALKEAFGLFEIERDEDGDIPLPYGSSVVFIRHSDAESPFLEIFAPLLHGFTMSPEVYEAANSINAQVPLAKAIVDADSKQIVLTAELPLIDRLSSDDLVLCIELVSDAADRFDTLLQKRFGGNMMLEDDDDEIEV
jgi:hypothetical protein